MKRSIVNLFKSIFGISITYSVLVGALVAVIYLIGFIAGGGTGEQLALFGAKAMNSAITISALGSVIGMIAFYVEGTHELTMDKDKDYEEENATA